MSHRPVHRHLTTTALTLAIAAPLTGLPASAAPVPSPPASAHARDAVPDPAAWAHPAAAVRRSAPAVAAGTQQQSRPDVRGWSVALDRRAVGPSGQRVLGRRSFETIGVTWAGGGDPHVQVRTRSRGVWSGWQDAVPLEGARQGATEPIWVGKSQAVQVRAERWRKGLSVVMVDPGEEPETKPEAPSDSVTSGTSTAFRAAALQVTAATAQRRRFAPRPKLHYRWDWGANEKLRDGDPVYVSKIKQAHVHHTAGSSSYSRDDVPGIIRGMYWYHTKQLGWSDLGYNFLVDRFGRIWVGRAGGYTRRVRGAHTLGFNHASFGVAVIGNMENLAANEKLKGALVRLIAWKLDKDRREPARKVTIYSKGSDLYPKGTKVRLPTIDGHRDTNQTACPGRRLYRILPEIRRRAQARADRWS